jgi:hypothetical protein
MRHNHACTICLVQEVETTRHDISSHLHLDRRSLKFFSETSAEQPNGVATLARNVRTFRLHEHLGERSCRELIEVIVIKAWLDYSYWKREVV